MKRLLLLIPFLFLPSLLLLTGCSSNADAQTMRQRRQIRAIERNVRNLSRGRGLNSFSSFSRGGGSSFSSFSSSGFSGFGGLSVQAPFTNIQIGRSAPQFISSGYENFSSFSVPQVVNIPQVISTQQFSFSSPIVIRQQLCELLCR